MKVMVNLSLLILTCTLLVDSSSSTMGVTLRVYENNSLLAPNTLQYGNQFGNFSPLFCFLLSAEIEIDRIKIDFIFNNLTLQFMLYVLVWCATCNCLSALSALYPSAPSASPAILWRIRSHWHPYNCTQQYHTQMTTQRTEKCMKKEQISFANAFACPGAMVV